MNERPRFDMGLSELAEKKGDSDPTDLKHFRDTGGIEQLFEAEGYIWRKLNAESAVQFLTPELQDEVKGATDEQTLRKMATYATSVLEKLKTFGIRCEAKYIVHDVNAMPHLVAVVPKVEGRRLSDVPEDVSTEELPAVLGAFNDLYRKLLAYYENVVDTGEPIMWDSAVSSQYVYETGPDGSVVVTLVDPDPRIGNELGSYQSFITNGRDAIINLLWGVGRYHPSSLHLPQISRLRATAAEFEKWADRARSD